MADKIRGLTVEISADASQFNKQMSAVRKEAKSSKEELTALQKSLDLEFDGEKLARAQKVAQDAIDATAQRADVLRERLKFLEENGDADTSHYRQIQAELAKTELEGQQLEKQLEKLNDMKLDRLAGQVKNVGDGFTSAGQALTPLSVAAGATLAGVGALGLSAVSSADDIATLATQYDMSAEALQRFNYVALQTDTDSEVLYKAFVKMRAGVADFATGTTSVASTALQQLNLDLNKFDGSEEQFYGIISALADMEDKTQMIAIANDLFGEKLANNLLPLIYSGSDAIAAYSEEFSTLGALSDEQVNKLAEFDNVMNTINTQLANTKLQMGEALLPVMEIVAEFLSTTVIPKLRELAAWFGNLSPSTQTAILGILGFIALVAPLLMAIGKMTTGLSTLIKFFGKLKAAQWQAIGGFAALMGAAALAFDIISNWKSMSWVEKLLKTLALAALVAAAAVTVFHASWSLGIAIAAITAGIVAGIAAINAAKSEVLPEADDFSADSIESAANMPSTDYDVDFPTPSEGDGTVYDNNDIPTSGDTYNYDYSTNETTQNVTVTIENYAAEVDVDALVDEINVKLAEVM